MTDSFVNRLGEVSFVSTAIERVKPLAMRAAKAKAALSDVAGKQHPISCTPQETYSWSVFYRVARLCDCFGRMDEAIVYMGLFPRHRALRERGITRDRWFDYHFAIFASAITTTADVSLHLINDVYQIGLDERDCRAEVVLRNNRVKETPVAAAFRTYEKVISKYKTLRNLDQHRAERASLAEIIQDDLYETAPMLCFVGKLGGLSSIEESSLKLVLRTSSEALRDKMLGAAEASLHSISDLLGLLKEPFDRAYTRLEPIENQVANAMRTFRDARAPRSPEEPVT